MMQHPTAEHSDERTQRDGQQYLIAVLVSIKERQQLQSVHRDLDGLADLEATQPNWIFVQFRANLRLAKDASLLANVDGLSARQRVLDGRRCSHDSTVIWIDTARSVVVGAAKGR